MTWTPPKGYFPNETKPEKVWEKYDKWADKAESINTWNAHYGTTDEGRFHMPETCWYCRRAEGLEQ